LLEELILSGNPLNENCKKNYEDFLKLKTTGTKTDSL